MTSNSKKDNNMKTTVLKASVKLAHKIRVDLLNMRGKTGNPIFKEFRIEHGFELKGRKRNEAGEVVEDVIFRYTDNPAPRIDYNENIIQLGE
jgi:hypothetical protein